VSVKRKDGHDAQQLLQAAKDCPIRTVAVAVGQDPTVIQAVAEAKGQDISHAVLVGNEAEVKEAAERAGIPLAKTTIVDEEDPIKAAAAADAGQSADSG